VTGELMDNSAAFLLPGVWSSRMYLKQANRRLEHLLTRKLEPLLAMTQAFLPPGSFRYPTHELDLAWKLLLLNHPHDSICGCSVDAVHRENEVRFEQVEQIAEALNARAKHGLSTLGSKDEWVVFNMGDTAYTGVVSIIETVPEMGIPSKLQQIEKEQAVLQNDYLHTTHQIPLAHLTQQSRNGWIWVESIPPFGFQLVSKELAKKVESQPIKFKNTKLENKFLRVQLQKDGTLLIQDKCSGVQYEGLFIVQSQQENGDSYNHAPVPNTGLASAYFISEDQHEQHDYASSQSGDLVARFCLMYSFRHQHQFDEAIVELELGNRLYFFTEITLRAGCPRLEFHLSASEPFTGDHKILIAFKTNRPVASVSAESHLGILERQYDPGYREEDFMPTERMKELKTNSGPVQRFFSANGQTFLTEGLTEYTVYQDTIYLTLHRPFDYLSKGDTGVRGAQAGPPFRTWDGTCIGRDLNCRFAWMPTPDDPAKLYEAAGRFYGNVWGLSGTGRQKTTDANSLVSWDNPALVSSACYWLPDRGLILRLINITDRELSTAFTVGFKHHAIHETNMLEEIQRTLPDDTTTIGPRDVKTLLFALPPQTGV
jgi:mannosylglycerate hydrolase